MSAKDFTDSEQIKELKNLLFAKLQLEKQEAVGTGKLKEFEKTYALVKRPFRKTFKQKVHQKIEKESKTVDTQKKRLASIKKTTELIRSYIYEKYSSYVWLADSWIEWADNHTCLKKADYFLGCDVAERGNRLIEVYNQKVKEKNITEFARQYLAIQVLYAVKEIESKGARYALGCTLTNDDVKKIKKSLWCIVEKADDILREVISYRDLDRAVDAEIY